MTNPNCISQIPRLFDHTRLTLFHFSFTGKTEKGDGAKVKPDSVLVVADDFFQALGSLTPSLSDEEVSRYVRMREDFEGSRLGANLG